MTPPFLQPSDQIHIVTPSGAIQPMYIDGATKTLTNWGLKVTEGNFARSQYGRFGGTPEQRISDLQQALDNPHIKAILCSRGGYGVAQIIDKLDFTNFMNFPKWLIGFSDITILHNAINNLGVASLHASMAKHLAELPPQAQTVQYLKEILFGSLPSYSVQNHTLNRCGSAEAKLIGGNLSVLMAMRGSKFDLAFNNNILFIEDIAEKPYHIDRMMQNLRFSGALAQLSGLVVGQFSDCQEDPLMNKTISEIIFDAVSNYHYPICFNFQAGHVDQNLPLVMGNKVKLTVSDKSSELTF